MSAHTAGCTAATAGIAASASVLTATIFLDRVDETDVAKNLKKVMDATLPLNLTCVLAGTVAALAQAYRTPATKPLWFGAAGLLASVIPYTYFLVKDDCVTIFKAGEEKKAPAAGTVKRVALHGYVRAGLLAASTGIMVYALAKKAKH